MSNPRLPLLALVLALVVLILVGPGPAAAAGAESIGTPTLTTPVLTATEVVETTEPPTVTVTATEVVETGTVEPTADSVEDTVDDTTEDAADSVENTTEGTTDSVEDTTNETVDSTTSLVHDSSVAPVGEGAADTARLVEPVLSPDGTDATTGPTPTPAATSAPRPAGSGSEMAGSTEVAAPPPDRSDGPPLEGPAGPLAGGAALGGAIAITGLAGRGLLAVQEPFSVTGRTISTALRYLAAGVRDKLWPALGLFGYQRFDDSNPLAHTGREQLYECIRAEPGVHLSAVSESADLPLSTARYHLRILEHEGLVRGVKLNGKRRFFPPDVEAEALVAALAEDATATVLRSLVREGPGSVSELADRLDRDPSTVSHHLDRLADDGLVERERQGPAVVSAATSAVEVAVEEFEAGRPDAVQSQPAATSD